LMVSPSALVPLTWKIGDLIGGSKDTLIAIFEERKSRFTMLVKVPGKGKASVKRP